MKKTIKPSNGMFYVSVKDTGMFYSKHCKTKEEAESWNPRGFHYGSLEDHQAHQKVLESDKMSLIIHDKMESRGYKSEHSKQAVEKVYYEGSRWNGYERKFR